MLSIHKAWSVIFVISLTSCSFNFNKKLMNHVTEDDFFDLQMNEDNFDYNNYVTEKISDDKDNAKMDGIFFTPITIVLNEKINITKAFILISENLNINLHIPDDISGNVFLKIKNEKFINIVKYLCNQSGLRYSVDGKTLTIEKDIPYFKTYNVNFLNILRESNSTISTKTNIFASGNELKGNGDENASTNTVTNKDKSDFWTELESTLKSITKNDITIHRQAGLISVKCSDKEHKLISEYLKKLKKIVNAQVVIEAKILEVALDKNFIHGINWNILGRELENLRQIKGVISPISGAKAFNLGFYNKNLNVIVNFLEKFGSVRTLSSPRITVMNNQTAILKVARQEVYFNLISQNNYNNVQWNSNFRETIYSNINTIPVGIVISVHPVIDIETGKIILTLRPSISKIVGSAVDPSVKLNVLRSRNGVNINDIPDSSIPIVEVREVDSVLNMLSGEVVMLGGLMQETVSAEESRSVPFKNVFSDLFLKGKDLEKKLTEIIIFLKVKILNTASDSFSEKDVKVYNKYSNDNRKLKFKKNRRL